MVMRSVENARVALEDGDPDKAIKMMISADQLCARVVAPPTIHGLAMRVISDAYVAKGELADAKKALQKGLDLCKPHDGKAGMPEFMRQDLNGRMGDLLMALGEIEKTEGAFKDAARNMRRAAERFEVLGQKEFVAATLNRVALCLMEQGKHDMALSELAEAEGNATGNEHEAALLSSTLLFRARCLASRDELVDAREAMTRALTYAMACGSEPVVAECEAFLGETQEKSTGDEGAFL